MRPLFVLLALCALAGSSPALEPPGIPNVPPCGCKGACECSIGNDCGYGCVTSTVQYALAPTSGHYELRKVCDQFGCRTVRTFVADPPAVKVAPPVAKAPPVVVASPPIIVASPPVVAVPRTIVTLPPAIPMKMTSTKTTVSYSATYAAGVAFFGKHRLFGHLIHAHRVNVAAKMAARS